MWNDGLAQHVEQLTDGSDRIAAVKIHTSNGYIIVINTYMPTEGTHIEADYSSLLDEVFEVVQKYSSDAKALWVGDMNALPDRRHTKNDKMSHPSKKHMLA